MNTYSISLSPPPAPHPRVAGSIIQSLISYYLIVLHSTYLTGIWITLLCRQPLVFCSFKIFKLLYFLLLLYNCALGWVVALYTFRISTETSPLKWFQYLDNFGSTFRKTNRCFYISSHRPLEPFDLMWHLIDSLLQQLVPVKWRSWMCYIWQLAAQRWHFTQLIVFTSFILKYEV